MTSETSGRGTPGETSPVLRPGELDAAVFDMDGVLTDTAALHFRTWKETFDAFLESRAEEVGRPSEPFTRNDHRRHVQGRPRYEGARDFLGARGIELPFGAPDDPPESETVCGLGNRKDRRYRERLAEGDLEVFPDALRLVRRLRGHGVPAAVATSSRNGRAVVRAAGIEGHFDAVLDGEDLAADASLTGKPAPDVFLEAARRLDADAGRSVVVEDSASGVEAGRRGGFGLVIGVARGRGREELERAGADLVVPDLGRVPVSSGVGRQAARDRPGDEQPVPGGAGEES